MPGKKYLDFTESEPRELECKQAPGKTRLYVSISCPHCKVQFIDIPMEQLLSTKASKCLQHLRRCKEYGGVVMSAPEKMKDPALQRQADVVLSKGEELVTIYKIVYRPDNRAVYTGRTKNTERRLKQHASRSSGCRLLRNAIRRYGISKFAIQPIVRCMPDDADANESYYIMTNNTMHPNGYNLRHGSMAGVENDNEVALIPTSMIAFEGVAEELRAQAEATHDVAELCEELEDSSTTDNICRDILRDVHPDRAGDRSYSAGDVAAMINTVRESVRVPI